MRTAPVQVGSRVEVAVEKLVAGGDALCRAEGFPIFVPGLFPGDVAQVVILEVKRGFARGRPDRRVKESRGRRIVPCPVAEECGGCDWAALRLDQQLDAKVGILVDSLRRTGRMNPADLPPIHVHPSPLNYRIRSRLHIDGESGSAGFFARRSHRVVPIPPECEVLGRESLSGILATNSARSEVDTIDLFESDGGLVLMRRNADDAQKTEVEVRVGARSFRLSTSSFFQVNRHLLTRLGELVVSIANGMQRSNLALDLYGGVGFFALFLSDVFTNVVTVETDPESCRFARRNVEHATGVEVVEASAEEFLGDMSSAPEFVLVDPPRAGLSVGVRKELRRLRPRGIAYLSCDPVTFSRDVAEIVGDGWVLHTLDLLDLFPNTHHVETLASLMIED